MLRGIKEKEIGLDKVYEMLNTVDGVLGNFYSHYYFEK